MDEGVKAGLLDLVDHAVERGWSARRAAGLLGLDHVRLGRWEARREAGQLADRAPGGHPLHGLPEAERAAIVALFEAWGEIDRSRRKLAHRGSRLQLVHVSESTVRRVLAAEGYVLPGQPPREPTPRTPWPDWLEWKPNRVWAYDFTHFTRARRAVLAVIDVVSPKVDHHPGLCRGELGASRGRLHRRAGRRGPADARATAALLDGDRDQVATLTGDGQLPLLLAISDNGPQMRSVSTREFLAGVAIAQQFGRPHTPEDQAWIETLFGHVKGEWPNLEKISDPGELRRAARRGGRGCAVRVPRSAHSPLLIRTLCRFWQLGRWPRRWRCAR